VERHAIQCSLHNIQPFPGPHWPKAGECDSIDELFRSSDLEYTVISLENGIFEVSIRAGGNDLGDLLVQRKLAKKITLPKIETQTKPGKTFYQCRLQLADNL